MAEYMISDPGGNCSALNSKSRPLRTDKQAIIPAPGCRIIDSIFRRYTSRSLYQRDPIQLARRSYQPISRRSRDHMTSFLWQYESTVLERENGIYRLYIHRFLLNVPPEHPLRLDALMHRQNHFIYNGRSCSQSHLLHVPVIQIRAPFYFSLRLSSYNQTSSGCDSIYK